MKETVDTLGNQKKMNYALRADMTKAEFVKEVTDGLEAPPSYFPENVRLNKEGYESIDAILSNGLKQLSSAAFETIANETGALVLDVRTPFDFATGHIPNSIFIGLDGSFAPWVGELVVDVKQPIILVAPAGREEEAVTRLSRVGFDNTMGYLQGGIDAWEEAGKETDTVNSVAVEQFADGIQKKPVAVFDVRRPSEFQAEHLEEAQSTPLSQLNGHLSAFPKEENFYVHCAGGYRSMIAASILKSRGYHNLIDVAGGFGAIQKTALKTTDFVCPSTLKT